MTIRHHILISFYFAKKNFKNFTPDVRIFVSHSRERLIYKKKAAPAVYAN